MYNMVDNHFQKPIDGGLVKIIGGITAAGVSLALLYAVADKNLLQNYLTTDRNQTSISQAQPPVNVGEDAFAGASDLPNDMYVGLGNLEVDEGTFVYASANGEDAFAGVSDLPDEMYVDLGNLEVDKNTFDFGIPSGKDYAQIDDAFSGDNDLPEEMYVAEIPVVDYGTFEFTSPNQGNKSLVGSSGYPSLDSILLAETGNGIVQPIGIVAYNGDRPQILGIDNPNYAALRAEKSPLTLYDSNIGGDEEFALAQLGAAYNK